MERDYVVGVNCKQETVKTLHAGVSWHVPMQKTSQRSGIDKGETWGVRMGKKSNASPLHSKLIAHASLVYTQ
jgi:hypothetical protein